MANSTTIASQPSLSEIDFFKVFPAQAIENLERAATLRKFKKHSHIIVAGEQGHAAYVLLEGTAYAFTDDDEGNEFIVSSFAKGDCLGELVLLHGRTRKANGITTSTCQCTVIPRAEINHEILKDVKVAQAIIHLMVGRIRCMTEDVSFLALMDVYGRLVRMLNSSTSEQEKWHSGDRAYHASGISQSRGVKSRNGQQVLKGIARRWLYLHREPLCVFAQRFT